MWSYYAVQGRTGRGRTVAAGYLHCQALLGTGLTHHKIDNGRVACPPHPSPMVAYLFPLSAYKCGGGRARVPWLVEREGRARRALHLHLPLVTTRTASALLLLVLGGALERHFHDGCGSQRHLATLARTGRVRSRGMPVVAGETQAVDWPASIPLRRYRPSLNKHVLLCTASGTCLAQSTGELISRVPIAGHGMAVCRLHIS